MDEHVIAWWHHKSQTEATEALRMEALSRRCSYLGLDSDARELRDLSLQLDLEDRIRFWFNAIRYVAMAGGLVGLAIWIVKHG